MGTDTVTVTATSAAGTAIGTVTGTGTGTNPDWIASNMAFIVCIALVVIAILIGGSIAFSTFYSMKNSILNLELLRLYFAMGILTGLGLLFAFAITVYVWGPTNSSGSGKEVFDACVKVIPPIITLILGYYFGTALKGDNNKPPIAQEGTRGTQPLPGHKELL